MSQIPDAQPERRLIFGPTSPIPGGASELGEPTGPRTTHLKRPVKPLGQFPAAGGPQTFFRRASDSMCLSSVRSATNRFSRAFSSSTCRSRRSSLFRETSDVSCGTVPACSVPSASISSPCSVTKRQRPGRAAASPSDRRLQLRPECQEWLPRSRPSRESPSRARAGRS